MLDDSQPNLKCNLLINYFAEALDLALDEATGAFECNSNAFISSRPFIFHANSKQAFLLRSVGPC